MSMEIVNVGTTVLILIPMFFNTVVNGAECSYSSSYFGGNLLATTSAGLQCENVEEVHGTNIVEMVDNHEKEDKIEILKRNCIIDNPQHEEIAEGQLYWDKETLISVIKHYTIREKCQFIVDRSSTTRYCLTSVDKGCKWSLRSSSLHKSNVFKVRGFNVVHTFPETSRLFSQRHATSSAIANMICNKYANPKIIYTPADIMSDMKQQYGINMSYVKAYKTKEKAFELLGGIPREAYRKLPGHLYMINMTNPGSFTMLHKSEDRRFMYVFVALNASIIVWKYCYPIVVVHGTFLKSSHRGTMLTASAQDAADKYVADSQAFGERERMCIVSDHHASILRGASIVYPEISNRVCIYHIWNNIKKQFKKNHDRLREVFFAMARAYKIEDFNLLMQDMDSTDKRARGYLFQVSYEKCSIAHSTVNISMMITSNIAESLNARKGEARELPNMSLLDYMMNLVMEWNNTNRMTAMSTLLDYTYIEAPKYCSAYYTKEYFKKTYEVPVNPLPDETTWDLPTKVLDNVVLALIVKGKPRRPTMSRRKGLYEYPYTETVTCGLCEKQGHNRRTCRNAQDN
ncbi:uncharacterized protein [Nicotiana tomentosiformis]|uniref:uncharacterized protein n=1 Tax=Nicotiana tomentosiformis TaxID=4098 RepID=UPI00388C7ABF